MGTLQFGAWQAVCNCVKLQPGERVVMVTDEATRDIAEAILAEVEKISPGNTSVFYMEKYGPRPQEPDADHKSLAFPDEIGEALKKANVSFYSASCKKGELQSFRNPMLRLIESNHNLRHAHMPKITLQLMQTGMGVDYSAVQRLSAAVYEICHKASAIRVTNPAGTDFTAYFNPTWHWKISDGNITTPGEWTNLPDGEIFTCVENVPEGTIVADGILGDYFSEKYGLLAKNPVAIHIRDTKVVDVQCERQDIVEEFQERLKIDENANRVGEFAIGTNIGLKKLIGNLLQDEKFPGVHVAFGHGYPEMTGSPYHSIGHIDAVLKNTTIVVDGRIKGYPKDASHIRKTFRAFVRYVRGNPNYGKNDFHDNNDGTITDRATGLIWQKDDSKRPMNWEQSLEYASKLNLAGNNDWRLPNAKELQSIVDYTRSPDAENEANQGPAIDPIFQTTNPESYFWTSTTHIQYRFDMAYTKAVYICFGQSMGAMMFPGMTWKQRMNVHGAGAQRSDPKSGDPSKFVSHAPQGDDIRIFNYVRCVRGGK